MWKEWSVQSAELTDRQYYKYTPNVTVYLNKAVTQNKSQQNITNFQNFSPLEVILKAFQGLQKCSCYIKF